MRRTEILVAGALLCAATPVLAQDATGGGAPPPPPPAGSATATPSAPTAADWGQLDERPLVIPQGKFEVHAAVPIFASTITDPATGMSTTNTFEAMSLGATYGLADKVQVGADYAFDLHPNGDITTGFLGLHGAYAAVHTDKLDLAVSGSLVFDIGSAQTDYAVQIGAWARYHLAPKLSLFTGQPPIPFTLGGFSTFLAAPLGYQLQIGLNNNQAALLDLPVGLEVQATPQVFLFAETDLAEFYLSNGPANSSGFYIFSDFIPLALGAWFSASDKIDVGVNFADDLKHAGDLYVITFGARYYVL